MTCKNEQCEFWRMTEPDWDAVALHTASAVRAEVLILSCTPGATGQDIIGAVIREAKNWCADGIRMYLEGA